MLKQVALYLLLSIAVLTQIGCAPLAAGVVGGAVGAEIADDDDDDD
jgi:hypothetical protein